MARHKWEPFGLRGKIKKCKVCGCIKKGVNLTLENASISRVHLSLSSELNAFNVAVPLHPHPNVSAI